MSTVPQSGDSQSIPAIVYHPQDESSQVEVPSYALTFDGFRKWASSDEFPERGKITFRNGGLIVEMSPEYFETHNFIKTEITAVLYMIVRRADLGVFCSDRSLFSNPAASISTEPDAMFVSYESLRTGRAEFVRGKTIPVASVELIGAPDWILEIVSPSSKYKDKSLLVEDYFTAGVGEYWIVDALGDDLEFQILIRESVGFVSAPARDGWLQSPTFGRQFRLTCDENAAGWMQYTLHVKETD